MLYKLGGNFLIDGRGYHYVVVHESQVDEYLSDGWYLTPWQASTAEISPIPPSALSHEGIIAIKEAAGTQREIAERFGVSTYTVHRIKKGKIK